MRIDSLSEGAGDCPSDSSGNEDFNLKLSKERAKNIRDYVVLFGDVEAHRVEADGFGSSKPLIEELTEDDRSLNRRVEFEIYRPAIELVESN